MFSPQLQAALGIQTWAWVDEMYAERGGVMTKTVQEIMGDLLAIDEAIEQAVEDKKNIVWPLGCSGLAEQWKTVL